MSLIYCTNDCIYQINGECSLGHTASLGNASGSNGACAYFTRPGGENKQKKLPSSPKPH